MLVLLEMKVLRLEGKKVVMSRSLMEKDLI